MVHSRPRLFLIWGLLILFFALLSFDGNTHWDGTNYLYKSAFSNFDLDDNWIHYSGGFYSGRIFHILVLRSLFLISGVGIGPLIFVQLVMAVFIVGAGWLFSRTLKEMGCRRPIPDFGLVAFLFLPLSLYLGYKSLAETTAVLFTALSLYLFFAGIRKPATTGNVFLVLSTISLFLASNARVECLLGFAAVTLPYLCFQTGQRISTFRGLVLVGAVWLVLTAALGFSTGIWSLEFMLRRSEVYGAKFAADSLDYLPNPVVAILFGGGLWVFVLLSLAGLRRREVKIAWTGLIISMVPIALLADHTELRYYNPAVFSFALATALGLRASYGWLNRKLSRLSAGLVTTALFCAMVAGNQLFRPLQEVGTRGLSLVRLINRVKKSYPDPLVLTAHPHSTYSFLRICYPEMRIALDRDFEGLAPIKAREPEELAGLGKPWIYLSSRGPKERPLLTKILHRLRGREPVSVEGRPVIVTSWLSSPAPFSLELVDGEGGYLVFEIEAAVGRQ